MSVIPLKTERPNPTVVETQAEFDLEGQALLIQGLDSAQLADHTDSNVSYDLRIGNQYRDHRELSVKSIPRDGIITLHPGAALIIETAESLHLPRSMYGTIAPRVSLLQKGLSSTFSKVDPGYNGHLLITLFNLGKTTVTLQRGEPFCALTVFEVAPSATIYNKPSKHIDAEMARQPRPPLRDWLEANHVTVMIILILATLALAATHVIDFVYRTPH
jgi:deoxycytidine triphosphate deaminase